MSRDEITDTMVRAGAEELFHLASRGQSWHAAGHELQREFEGYVRRVMERGRVAELARQSQRRRSLP